MCCFPRVRLLLIIMRAARVSSLLGISRSPFFDLVNSKSRPDKSECEIGFASLIPYVHRKWRNSADAGSRVLISSSNYPTNYRWSGGSKFHEFSTRDNTRNLHAQRKNNQGEFTSEKLAISRGRNYLCCVLRNFDFDLFSR